jgi:hypothetical protein
MAVMLDSHLGFVTTRPWVGQFNEDLTALLIQLTRATEPHHRIGPCPNTITDGDKTRVCGAMLYAPTTGGVIQCWAVRCQRTWTRREWLRLADDLTRP